MVRSLPEPRFHRLPALISLSGKMGSGKDTVGALLSMVGYNCVSWASALKMEAFNSLAQSVAPQGMTPEVRQAWCAMEPEDVYRKPTSADARKVLQWWGTEYRRSKDPLYWIKALDKRLQPDTLYVITDTRFANEDDYVHARGGQSWMITRPDASQAPGIVGHASEQLDGIHPNTFVDNSGTVVDLAKKVKQILGLIV